MTTINKPSTNTNNRVLYKQALKSAIYKPNKNCIIHKYNYRLFGILQSSDKSFTIINIERKNNLLRTYNHIQSKQIP